MKALLFPACLTCSFAFMQTSGADNSVFTDFYSRIYVQGYVAGVDLAEDSPSNQGNALRLPETAYNLDLRADFEAKLGELDIIFRPRATSNRLEIETGDEGDITETDSEAFVNEWQLRGNFDHKVFVSYGREDLQWGPSYLLSPSNPFNTRNGQNNPVVEQPGLDFARIVWVANSQWSASFIANTDEGQLDDDNFEKSYAVKIDYEQQGKYFSVIPSVADDEESTESVGFYAGMSLNDATTLYTEGNISNNDASDRILVGSTFTTFGGYTIAGEILFNSEGCTAEPFAQCQEDAANSAQPEQFSLSGLNREKYLLLQAHKGWNNNESQLTLRLIHNLDDQSNRFIAYGEHGLSDHLVVFSLVNINTGDTDSEFGFIADNSMIVGLGYTF